MPVRAIQGFYVLERDGKKYHITNPEAVSGATSLGIVRKLFVTDKDGVEHAIRTQEDLDIIMAQMTPEQKKKWEDNYRFCPVRNGTGNKNYVGTGKDLM